MHTHPPPPSDLARLKDAFDDVAERPRAERELALAQLAARDPDLALRVRELFTRERDERALPPLFRLDDAPTLEPLAPGAAVGAARIERLRSRRAYSELYEARHAVSDQRLAVKLLLDTASLLDPASPHEARILASLDHPAIVPILEAGILDREGGVSNPYLTMPLIEGEDLRAWRQRARPAPRELARLLADIADGAHHAHLRGVVHRDLKPSNILIDHAGRPRLLDFGVSVLTTARPRSRAGTPGYMPPEQLRPDAPPPDPRTDIFALAVILAELLAGARIDPDAPDAFQRFHDSLEPALRNARIPAQLRAVVLTAASLDPDSRYDSAAELAADLRRAALDIPIAAAPPSLPRRIALACRRRPALALLALLLALAVVAAIAGTATQAVRATRAQQRAETRYEHARDFANWVINDLDRQLRRMPNSTEARRAIIARATETLDALQSTASGDSDILLDVAEAKLTLARVLSHYYGRQLGDDPPAQEILLEIEPIIRSIADTGDRRAALLLLRTRESVFFSFTHQQPIQEPALLEAIRLGQTLDDGAPAIGAKRAFLSSIMSRFCRNYRSPESAAMHAEQARRLAELVDPDLLHDLEPLTDLGMAHLYVGLFDMEEDPLAGEPHFLLATRCFERADALEGSPGLSLLARALFYHARSRANHADLAGALSLIERAITLSRANAAADPDDFEALRLLEVCLIESARTVAAADLSSTPPAERRSLLDRARSRAEEAIAVHQQRIARGLIPPPDVPYLDRHRETLDRLRQLSTQQP